MLAAGVIRRIGAVPNHYALGYRANGMSVWDVEDARLPELGPAVGALARSSATATAGRAICRSGPTTCSPWSTAATARRWRPRWREIAALLGAACRGHDVLYSTRDPEEDRASGSGE